MSAVRAVKTNARYALRMAFPWHEPRRNYAAYHPIRGGRYGVLSALSASNDPVASTSKAAIETTVSPQLSQSAQYRVKQPPSLLKYVFELDAKPINCTTFQSTKSFIADDCHPYFIRTRRRLDAFDPNILRWRVHVPTEACKKAAIRDNVKKRVKHVFMTELRNRGYHRDGRVREAGRSNESERGGPVKEGLRGALLIILPKDAKKALTFTEAEVTESVKFVLNRVVYKLKQVDCAGKNERL